MIKIRLMRIGAKQRPFYRIVVVDERSKRTGAYIELLGTYNPLTEPKDIKLKQDRIDYWIKQGAQPSTGYLRMIGKAPQRPPRKPKKQKQESSDMNQAGQPKPEEKPAETPTEEPTEPADQPERKQTDTAETPTTETPTPEENEQAPAETTKEAEQK